MQAESISQNLGSRPRSHAALVDYSGGNVTFTEARLLTVGTSGAVKVDTDGGETLILPAMPDGYQWPIYVVKVYQTGSAGTNIVSMW